MANLKLTLPLFILLIMVACHDDHSDDKVTGNNSSITGGYSSAALHIDDTQGKPPAGVFWEVVEVLSDEFNGTSLDLEQWNDLHPRWSGRAPSQFKRENTTVGDGYLRLKSTSRVDDLSQVSDPETDIWVDAASITSKGKTARPGYYYETSMKASDLSMTSSYWFRMGEYSEIDVVEQLGHPSRPESSSKEFKMLMNTHVYGSKSGASTPRQWQMPTRSREEFHVYGLWWKSPDELLFYHNGTHVETIVPSVSFEEDLFMIFDTEVFVWDGLPTIAFLKDDSKNTMLVDFVRTYKVASDHPESGLLKNGSFETGGIDDWLWKGDVTLNTNINYLHEGAYTLKLINNASVIQEVKVTKHSNYTLYWSSSSIAGTSKVEIVDIAEKITNNAGWTDNAIKFNTGNNDTIYLRVSTTTSSEVYFDSFRIE